MPETKAFDLSKYTATSSSKIALDLASLSIETESVTPERTFIVPFIYTVDLVNQKVLCPAYDPDTDIRALFLASPEVLDLCTHALNPDTYSSGQFGYLWISGPDDYPYSRLQVGVGQLLTPQIAQLINYSGLDDSLTSQQCLDLGRWASQFSLLGLSDCITLAELRCRNIFFYIPDTMDPWDYIFIHILHRPDLFQKIYSGQAVQVFLERLAIASRIAPVVATGLLSITSDRDYIYLGAWAERQLSNQAGITLQGRGSGCGLTNSELLCQPIVCPSCNWRPDTHQLAAISSGHLKNCPCCTYDPASRRLARPDSHSHLSLESYKLSPSRSVQSHTVLESSPPGLSWDIYFFQPWLESVDYIIT